jgi:signal transduction histidine kinase
MVYTTVAALLGGRVTLDSDPGRGTRVVLEIPAVAPAARAA